MKITLSAIFSILTILIIIGSVNAYKLIGDYICTCDSCEDCTNALNSEKCREVKLIVNITSHYGNCIDNPLNFKNKIFDCQGNRISGDGGGSGIYLNRKQDNIIRNCAISYFEFGIYIGYSSKNILRNNDLNSNVWAGIFLNSSSNTIIANNTVNLNNYGIVLFFSSKNNVTNNIVNSNYDGIYIINSSDENIIESNIINSNKNGLYILYNSNFNKILNNEILNNSNSGIIMSNCNIFGNCLAGNKNNIIESNKIINNRIGIFSQNSFSIINNNSVCNNTELDFSSNNWLSSSGSNNACDKPDGWNDNNKIGCTYRCFEEEKLKESRKEVQKEEEQKEGLSLWMIGTLIGVVLIFLIYFILKRREKGLEDIYLYNQ